MLTEMQRAYVVGPGADIGNAFGYSGHIVPDGRWAIVVDGEYCRGGYGPSSVDGKLYASEAAARAALQVMRDEEAAEVACTP